MSGIYSISLKNPIKYVTGVDSVVQNWNIILSTIPGSIPLRPTFGSSLYQYLDKPVNTFYSQMAGTIIKDLQAHEPRATVSKVTRSLNLSQILLTIYGKYIPTGEEVVTTVEINQNNHYGIGRMIIGQTFIIQ